MCVLVLGACVCVSCLIIIGMYGVCVCVIIGMYGVCVCACVCVSCLTLE